MIKTTKDMYMAFLDGIKKSSTAIVTPEMFNRIINDWGQDEWLRLNLPIGELGQKQIDSLQGLRTVTDGSFTYNSVVLYPIAPVTGKPFDFKLPFSSSLSVNSRRDDGSVVTQNYPKYLRLMNVSFRINYVNNICGLTGTSETFDRAWIMRSDQRSINFKNKYRKPADDMLYYEQLADDVRLITGTSSTGYAMRLEYYRWPVEIFFNKAAQADTGNPLTGSVMCELGELQRKEIVDVAIRVYLERVSDPRYASFSREEAMRKSTN